MDSFDASVSGVKAAFFRQEVTANDVANVNTIGYRQITPYQTEAAPQGGTRVSHLTRTPNGASMPSTTDLAEETKEQIENKGALQANLGVIKAKDKMLGDLLDMLA